MGLSYFSIDGQECQYFLMHVRQALAVYACLPW